MCTFFFVCFFFKFLTIHFTLQYVNPAYESIMGYQQGELIGKEIIEVPKSEKNKPDLLETINSCIRKGKVTGGLIFYTFRAGYHLPMHNSGPISLGLAASVL